MQNVVTDNLLLLLICFGLIVSGFTVIEFLGWWSVLSRLTMSLLHLLPCTSVHTDWFLRLPLVLGYQLTKYNETSMCIYLFLSTLH